MPELMWIAVYGDNSALFEYNDDGTTNSYGDIDRKLLEEFRLVDRGTGEIRYAVFLDPDQRLIWRRRVFLKEIPQSDQPAATERTAIHLVGWQQTIAGQNLQSIAYVPEDSPTVISAGRFREGHQLFYGVEPFAGEEDSPAAPIPLIGEPT